MKLGSPAGTVVVVVGAAVVVVDGGAVVVVEPPAVVLVVDGGLVVVVEPPAVVVVGRTVVVVAPGWQVGQPWPVCVGCAAMTATPPWQPPHLVMSAVPTPGAPVWQALQLPATLVACAGTLCGNTGPPLGPWQFWQPELKPPENALAWLLSSPTATNTAKATITSATMRNDIFFIVTSLPLHCS